MPLFTHILALATVALVALSSFPAHANALAADHAHAARNVRGHDAVAKRRRDASSSSTCKPRPSTSLITPTPTTTATPSTPPSAASSTAPSPSATSSSSAKKMGLAWGYDNQYLSNFDLPRVGWYHNWSPIVPGPQLQALGINPIPLLWSGDQAHISQFQQYVVAGYAQHAGAFNEPDIPTQANMLPSDAAQIWHQVMDPLKDMGYTLHGPCCTDSPDAKTWYQEFMGNCTIYGCKIDWMCLHGYNTDATSITEYLTWLHDTFGLPVILTEVGDEDYSGANQQAATLDDVVAFAETLVNFTDQNDWMVATFPYGVMESININPLNALLNDTTNYPSYLAYKYFGER